MTDHLNKLVIEVPFERDFAHVLFQQVSPWLIHVEASRPDGQELDRSDWEPDASLSYIKNVQRAEAVTPDEFFAAVVRRYLREFPAIFAASSRTQHYRITRQEYDLAWQNNIIAHLAREIADLVIELAVLRSRLAEISGELLLHPIKEWERAELVIGDSVPAEVPRFYQEYLALTTMALSLAEQREWFEAKLRRVSTLGIQAIGALAALDSQSSSPAVSNGKHAPWGCENAVHLRYLQLQNIRCFEKVTFSLTPPDSNRGQWITLLGDNGVGKTTILRAVALALLPPRTANSLIEQFMAGTQLTRSNDARDDTESSITVELNDARISSVIVAGDVEQESLTVRTMPDPLPLVFAYGCRRGSATGGPDRSADTTPRFGVNTLFHDNASLVHAETWLRKRHHVANVIDQREGPFYQAVKNTLTAILQVEDIEFDTDHVMVRGDAVGRVPIAALSDGYLTTLGWTVDFIARFAEHARQHDYPLDGDFAARMPCVVLIDELDLHLHPRWQTEIITQLRNAFPLTTFITTTHNPLTLRGTEPGEVFVLRRTEGGTIEAVPRDLAPGLHTDQILTGDWFGLPSSLVDRHALDLLKKHRQMLWRRVPADDPERRAIEVELRKRLGSFGDTATERLAQQVVADYLEGETRPITDADRDRLVALFKREIEKPTDEDGLETSVPSGGSSGENG